MDEPRYAWVVVWASFFSLAVSLGVAYSFAAYFGSFVAEFSAQRGDVSLVFGLSGLIYFALGAGGGILADRFGPRLVCGSGMLCIAGGLFATSLAHSMSAVYLTYAAGVGVGIALVYTPSIACVQPWFFRRRGLASGIASAGIGAGTLVVPLLAAGAIAWLDWRDALRVMSLGVLIVGFGSAMLLKRAPSATVSVVGAVSGTSLREALHSREFLWLYVAAFAAGPTMFIPFAHLSAAARDMGIDAARAVGLVGLIGIGSLVGRFSVGSLADSLGRSLTLAVMQVSMGASYVCWSLAGGYSGFALFALWFGLSYGGIAALWPAICMDLFGARAVSSIIGTLYTAAAVGNLLGPVVAGMVFDRTGSYVLVIATCMALSAVAAMASFRFVVPRQVNL